MQITYDLTVEDHLFFQMHHLKRSPEIRKQVLTSILICEAAFALLPVYFLFIKKAPLVTMWPFLIGLVLCPVFIYFRIKKRMRKSLTKHIQGDGDTPGAPCGPTTVAIREDGLLDENHTGQSVFKWAAVAKVLQTPTHVFVYIGAMQAIILPLHAFENTEAAQAFVQAIADKAGQPITHSK